MARQDRQAPAGARAVKPDGDHLGEELRVVAGRIRPGRPL
jgi:hypothetical protein